MPDFSPTATASEKLTPTDEMKAWLDGAKEIGDKIGKRIDEQVGSISGKSLPDVKAKYDEAQNNLRDAVETARTAWFDRFFRDYKNLIDPDMPSLPSVIAKHLGVDLKQGVGSSWEKLTRAMVDKMGDREPQLREEMQKYLDAEDAARAAQDASNAALKELVAVQEQIPEITFRVLSEIRELGGVDVNFADTMRSFAVRRDVANDADMAKELNEIAQKVFPKDWLNEANRLGDVTIGRYQRRGWAETIGKRSQDRVDTVINARSGDKGLLAHEFMHRMEYAIDGISRAEWTFLHQRMEGVKGRISQKLKTLIKGSGYGNEEVALRDGFKEYYTGKFYDPFGGGWNMLSVDERTAFEVMTTGIQDLVTGGVGSDDMGVSSGFDPEFRSFLLGTLATI